MLFRFAQGSVHRHGVFNGDPHPGNYRFHADGSITFLDFGLVKRWTAGEWERAGAVPRRDRRHRDPDVLRAGHGERRLPSPATTASIPQLVFGYVSAPVRAVPARHVHVHAQVHGRGARQDLDINGPYAEVIRTLNMPPSFVILDRVVWGVSALLGKLEATGPWKGIMLEYRLGTPPCTELGREDEAWRESAHAARRQHYGASG